MNTKKIWFPDIDKYTEDIIKNCPACQVVTNNVKPKQMSLLPDNKKNQMKLYADTKRHAQAPLAQKEETH